MSWLEIIRAPGFWRRVQAMLTKEFIQLRRDRVSFAMIVMIPVMQLVLFGFAINTTPRNLPTAVLLQETSDVGRTILAAIERTQYFKITHRLSSAEEFDRVLASGRVLFAIEIPAGFERALRRGEVASEFAGVGSNPCWIRSQATSAAASPSGGPPVWALLRRRCFAGFGSPPSHRTSAASYNWSARRGR